MLLLVKKSITNNFDMKIVCTIFGLYLILIISLVLYVRGNKPRYDYYINIDQQGYHIYTNKWDGEKYINVQSKMYDIKYNEVPALDSLVAVDIE